MASVSQTELKLTNQSDASVTVYLTLGDTTGCVQNVADIPFVTTVLNPLQGSFSLGAQKSVTYTPPSGECINGNFSFGTPPLNCPTDQFPNGVNLGEFILNNSCEGSGAQETVDISCVAGVNAFIEFTMSGGGTWNAGGTEPNVTSAKNKTLGQNCGQVGVYPYGCDDCTKSVAPPQCSGPPTPPPIGNCQTAPICNVQRDATSAGGTFTVTFNGFAT